MLMYLKTEEKIMWYIQILYHWLHKKNPSKDIGSNTKNELWGVVEKENDNWGAWFPLKAHVKSNCAVFAVTFNVTNNLC